MTGPATLPEWLRPPTPTGPVTIPEIPVAALLRTSTDDQQDPTLSLPRQLNNCQRALLPGMRIVAVFYDVESSRKELSQRGSSLAWQKFTIPGLVRDGGLADLLAEVQSPQRRFTAVICESIDRIARFTHQGTKIEHDLELAGVPLLAADEPIILDGLDGRPGWRRKRASQVLLRRTKQGVAEWYIIEMLEKSWDGFEVHTTQGWNVGKPPYGYLAEKHKHPVPARRAEGKHKHKLVIDPVRGPVVVEIYAWRIDEQLGYRAIAERLNEDLDRYAPPQPVDPERAAGCWSYSSVREILHNPKYTGYMVWNRRSTKDKIHPGKPNPRHQWVISQEPTHSSLVSVETFLAAQTVGPQRERSRSTADPAAPNSHSQTKIVYRLRSHVHCTLCQRRMHGKTKRANTYYYCQPRGRDIPDGHPPTIWLPERDLLVGLTQFFNTRILGPDRVALLERSITVADWRAAEEHQHKIDAVKRSITDTEQRLDRLTTTLEERDDPDGTIFGRVQHRTTELEKQLAGRIAELGRLEAAAPTSGPGPIELLDRLPRLDIDLAQLPVDRLRQFLDAFAIEIHYDRGTNTAIYRARISGHNLSSLAQLANAAQASTSTRPSQPAAAATRKGSAGRPIRHPASQPGWRSSVMCPVGGTGSTNGPVNGPHPSPPLTCPKLRGSRGCLGSIRSDSARATQIPPALTGDAR